MSTAPALLCFRDDLRLSDNPAVTAAVESGVPVIAVYVLDDESAGVRPLGAASRWWLHQSLESLRGGLDELGIPLLLRRGRANTVVSELAAESGAGAVFWNRRYGLAERTIDAELKSGLRAAGRGAESFSASLLFEPWTVTTGAGAPYSVFTPFWRRLGSLPEPRLPLPTPTALASATARASAVLARSLGGDELRDWGLQPSQPDWAGGLRASWQPGEASALQLLREFLADALPRYETERDLPAEQATSRLSPALRWGEISPHTVWHETVRVRNAAARASGGGSKIASAATAFLRQLAWREFAAHVSFHAPDLSRVNWRREFDAFEWPPHDPALLSAWQRGRTGVPLVDAGMRELWTTGTMHNRVRMVVASYLCKNLLIDWRQGEEWFWQTLVDADAASNAFNWQWVAGSGADAAPYFRVFNPLLQQQKFDPHGAYVRSHLPEWGTPDYPEPLVDLAESRRAALAAYERLRPRRRPHPAPAAPANVR